MQNYLSTFVLVNKDRVISPVLTTTREYGNWLETVFDSSICNMELYMRSKKKDGTITLEKHPGTRIGKFFDSIPVHSSDMKSWFILQDSPMMERLVKLKLAEQKDAIPISVNDSEGRRMIRVYTVQQIELYIKNSIDRKFDISEYIGLAKQIKVKDSDLGKIIMPKMDIQRKRLF